MTLFSLLLLLSGYFPPLVFQNFEFNQNSFNEIFPVSSPDGQRIAFLSNKDITNRTLRLFICNADGTGLFQVMNDGSAIFRATWFPDGKRLVIARQKGKIYQLVTIKDDGSDLQILTDNTKYTNNSAAVSPDGRFVVYESNQKEIMKYT